MTRRASVRAELRARVQWTWLDRPEKLNAFDSRMGQDLQGTLNEAARNAEVRCVVLIGEGPCFCGGEDLGADGPVHEGGLRIGEMLRTGYNGVVSTARRMGKPILAAINGATAGVGLGLALACDVRVASEKATFQETPASARTGQGIPMSFWLTRIVGHGMAMGLAMRGESMDARTALNVGLVNRVVAEEDFLGEVARMAERLAARQTAVSGSVKRTLDRAFGIGPESALEYEVYIRQISQRVADRVQQNPDDERSALGRRPAALRRRESTELHD